MFSKNKFKTSF